MLRFIRYSVPLILLLFLCKTKFTITFMMCSLEYFTSIMSPITHQRSEFYVENYYFFSTFNDSLVEFFSLFLVLLFECFLLLLFNFKFFTFCLDTIFISCLSLQRNPILFGIILLIRTVLTKFF